MALFLSTYTNKVDRKGRCSVPSAFRAILASQGHQSFIARPSFKHPAIECQEPEAMEQLWSQVDALDPFGDERDDLVWSTFSASLEVPIDPDGRIILPDSLREHTGVDEQVTFVGVGRGFQMWNPTTFHEKQQQAFANARNASQLLRSRSPAGGGYGT